MITLVCLGLLLLGLGGCRDYPSGADNFHLGNIVYSPEHQLLAVASISTGAVDLFRIRADGLDGAPLFVTRLSDARRPHSLRIALDRKRGWLWVLSPRGVDAYELRTFSNVTRVEPPSGNYHDRFSDLLVDTTGDVYLLVRGGARIYRLAVESTESLRMTLWVDVGPRATEAAVALANRLLRTTDGRYALMVSPMGETLLRVELGSGRVTPMKLSQAVDLTCGLPFWTDHRLEDGAQAGESSVLTMFDCLGRWEAKIRVADDYLLGSVQMSGANSAQNLSAVVNFPAGGDRTPRPAGK